MNIHLRLTWEKAGASTGRLFRFPEAGTLTASYLARIRRPFSASISSGADPPAKPAAGTRVWFCDRSRGSRMLDSASLASLLGCARDEGCRELYVAVGGADGFSKAMYDRWRPELRWSFGPLTLPHEIAAIVAAEQLYRGWTLLEGLPYHTGHER